MALPVHCGKSTTAERGLRLGKALVPLRNGGLLSRPTSRSSTTFAAGFSWTSAGITPTRRRSATSRADVSGIIGL